MNGRSREGSSSIFTAAFLPSNHGWACLGMHPPQVASGGAQRLLAGHLVEWGATARALDLVGSETYQLVRLDLVAARRARQREVEVRFALEPRRHDVRPSAVRTGFRTISMRESRPRKTSEGKYRLYSPQIGHLAAMG
jgi:hypothetical protein